MIRSRSEFRILSRGPFRHDAGRWFGTGRRSPVQVSCDRSEVATWQTRYDGAPVPYGVTGARAIRLRPVAHRPVPLARHICDGAGAGR